jgi:hypothetical protein
VGPVGRIVARLAIVDFLKPAITKIFRTFPRRPQRSLVESDCWTALDRLTLAAARHRSSFICRTTGRAFHAVERHLDEGQPLFDDLRKRDRAKLS